MTVAKCVTITQFWQRMHMPWFNLFSIDSRAVLPHKQEFNSISVAIL